MTIATCVICTTEELEALALLDDETSEIGGRQIDSPLANNLGEGTMVGKWVVSAHALIDPVYVRYYDLLSVLPVRVVDSEILFIPVFID